MATKLISDEAQALQQLMVQVRAHKAEAAAAFAERARGLGQATPPNLEPTVDVFLAMADAGIARAGTADQAVSSDHTTRGAPAGETKQARADLAGLLGRTRRDLVDRYGKQPVGTAVKWPLPHDDARLALHARETVKNLQSQQPTWTPLAGRPGAFDLAATAALLTQAADALDAARGHLGAHASTTAADAHARHGAEATLHDLHKGLLGAFVGLLHLAGLRELADEVASHHHVSHTKPKPDVPTPPKPQP